MQLIWITIIPAVTPQKAQQILIAALQDDSFPLGYLKSMAVGVARSGKTLTKKHVFKMNYDPNCSISTGVCEAPIFAFRQLTLQLIKALPSQKEFELLKVLKFRPAATSKEAIQNHIHSCYYTF